MKRFLTLTVLVVLAISLFVISSSAAVTTYDDAPAKTNIEVRTDDVVLFDDGFCCPVAYVFKDVTQIAGGGHNNPSIASSFDFTYINTKTGKSYTFDNIKEFDIPQGITYVGQYAMMKCNNLVRVSFPDSITSLGACIFQSAAGLQECTFEHNENSNFKTFPNFMFYDTDLRWFSMPDCITKIDGQAHFASCENLGPVYFSKNLVTLYSGNQSNALFANDPNVFFVNDPITSDNVPTVKPKIYYFPANLETITGETFKTCTNLNEVLVFGEKMTKIYYDNAPWVFNACGNNSTIVFLGDVESIKLGQNNSTFYWSVKNVYFANKNDKTYADVGYTGQQNNKVVFCNAEGNTTHLVEKNLGTEATCITNEFVKTYCFCGALVENKEVENTKTGVHVWTTNDCTVSVMCTDDENCTAMSEANAEHILVHTLVYANGFDNAGVYNCYCTADNCTMADKEIRDEAKGAIVTFKGYSVPEASNVKGINAGFKIDKALLDEYNEINDVDASLALFMVNSKNGDVNIDKILDGETLELANGVKGINVKITSTNYTDIGVEVRGFDNSTETSNYYTLNLITAIAVKTESGIHYVQAGLKTAPNTTQSVGGMLFNVVSADSVYSAVAQ